MIDDEDDPPLKADYPTANPEITPVNLRAFAREYNPEFVALQRAIFAFAVDILQDNGGHSPTSTEPVNIYIDRLSDMGRAFHTIFHIMALLAPADSPFWEVIGDIRPSELAPQEGEEPASPEHIERIMNRIRDGLTTALEKDEYKQWDMEHVARDIMASYTHDVLQHRQRPHLYSPHDVTPEERSARWAIENLGPLSIGRDHIMQIAVDIRATQFSVDGETGKYRHNTPEEIKAWAQQIAETYDLAFPPEEKLEQARKQAEAQKEAGEGEKTPEQIEEEAIDATLCEAYDFSVRDLLGLARRFADVDGHLEGPELGSTGVAYETAAARLWDRHARPEEVIKGMKNPATPTEEAAAWNGLRNFGNLFDAAHMPIYHPYRQGEFDSFNAHALENTRHIHMINGLRLAGTLMLDAAWGEGPRLTVNHIPPLLRIPEADPHPMDEESSISLPTPATIAEGGVDNEVRDQLGSGRHLIGRRREGEEIHKGATGEPVALRLAEHLSAADAETLAAACADWLKTDAPDRPPLTDIWESADTPLSSAGQTQLHALHDTLTAILPERVQQADNIRSSRLS